MHQLSSFCLYFDSRRINELDFLLQLARFVAHATLFHSTTSVARFLIMISATVVGLRSLESDVFLEFLSEKNAELFSISGICDINNTERISSVPWTLLHRHRMIMATRSKLSGIFPLPDERLVLYERILGPMTCPGGRGAGKVTLLFST